MPYACWFLWRTDYIEDFKWRLHGQFGVAFWRVVLREVYFEGPNRVWRALKTFNIEQWFESKHDQCRTLVEFSCCLDLCLDCQIATSNLEHSLFENWWGLAVANIGSRGTCFALDVAFRLHHRFCKSQSKQTKGNQCPERFLGVISQKNCTNMIISATNSNCVAQY